MLMRDLKPKVLQALLATMQGAAGQVDYRLYTTLIDVVVADDAPRAYLIARDASEALAKVKAASLLHEAFQDVTLLLNPNVGVPIVQSWLGISSMVLHDGHVTITPIIAPKHCDFRYRGCLCISKRRICASW